MARTLYKMNIDVRVINHPVETTGSIMWYTDYVVMETADLSLIHI